MSTRTKKDWLGHETLSARMTGVSPEQVTGAIGAAQTAWNSGRLIHIYRAAAMAGLDTEGLDEALDAILRIGWTLHSTALGMQTVGLNTQQALFVFTRPVVSPL